MSNPMPTLATVAGAKAVTSLSTVSSYFALEMSAQVGRQAQQVGKNAPCGHFGPSSRTLHDQRIVAIAARREAHHVIGERDIGKSVFTVQSHQTHCCLTGGIDTSDIAQHLIHFA